MLFSEFLNSKELLKFEMPDTKENDDFIMKMREYGRSIGREFIVDHDDFNDIYIIYNQTGCYFSNNKLRLNEINFKEVNRIRRMKYINRSSEKPGVYYDSNKNKWIANINIKGKNFYLGCFKEEEDAIKCREEAEKKYL